MSKDNIQLAVQPKTLLLDQSNAFLITPPISPHNFCKPEESVLVILRYAKEEPRAELNEQKDDPCAVGTLCASPSDRDFYWGATAPESFESESIMERLLTYRERCPSTSNDPVYMARGCGVGSSWDDISDPLAANTCDCCLGSDLCYCHSFFYESDGEVDVLTVEDHRGPKSSSSWSASSAGSDSSAMESEVNQPGVLFQPMDGSCHLPFDSCNGSGGGKKKKRDRSYQKEPEKREAHNDMERKRRNDLRGSFLSLQQLVPELASSSRTSKVHILQASASYLDQLHADEKRLVQTQVELVNERTALQAKVRALSGTTINNPYPL